MTEQEKLHQIFRAALEEMPSEVPEHQASVQNPAPFATNPAPAPAFQFPATAASVARPAFQFPTAATPSAPQAPPVPPAVATTPAINAGLGEAESAELGRLLDEQIKRKARKRRREAVLSLATCLAITGGSYGWFVQSPDRIRAFHEAVAEIRSSGDVAGMVAKYKLALAKVAVRSEQIDAATASMGADPTLVDDKDPHLQAEMKTFMGGEGKTTADRSQQLKEKFGSVAETGKLTATGGSPEEKPAEGSVR